jgi:hypothetical protein
MQGFDDIRESMRGGRAGDAIFRAGFVLQTLGAVSFVVLFVFGHPYYRYALGLFETGILLSAVFMKSRFGWAIKALLVWFAIGVVLQVTVFVGLPVKVFFTGLALVLLAGAVVSAHDAYERKHIEGWLFILAYPALVIPNLTGEGYDNFTILMGTLVAVLHVMVLRRMFSGAIDELRKRTSRGSGGIGEE